MLNLHQTSKMTQYKVYSLHCHTFTCFIFLSSSICYTNNVYIILYEDHEFPNAALQCRLLKV